MAQNRKTTDEVCATLAGLVVANNFDVARRPLMERSFGQPAIS